MKRLLTGMIVLAIIGSFMPFSAEAGGRRGDPVPPRLVSPKELAEIHSGQGLEFVWSSEGDRAMIRSYLLRIYQGPNTVESGLILKEEVPGGQTSYVAKPDLFQDGGTYCWSLRTEGSKKSRTAFSVFKVKKS